MADGRLRAQWGHTSAVLAMLANVHRDPKKRRRPYTAAEFNPYHGPGKSKIGNRLGKDISMDRFARELLNAAKGRNLRRRSRNRRKRPTSE